MAQQIRIEAARKELARRELERRQQAAPETPVSGREQAPTREPRPGPGVQQEPSAARLPMTTGPSVTQLGEPEPLREEFQTLITQLGGRMPAKGALPKVKPRRDVVAGGFGAELGEGSRAAQSLTVGKEAQRRAAFQKLQDAGHSIDEIVGALAFEEAIKPPSRALRTAGTVVGGIAASKLIPGPADDIAIGAKLLKGATKASIAGVGGVVGEAAQIALDPDREFNEAELKKLAGVFGAETALEAGTLGLARGGRKLIGGAKKTLIPGAKEMSDTLAAEGKRLGIETSTRFLPAQASENQLIDTIQGIGENSLIGSNVHFQVRKGQLKAGKSLLDNLSDSIAKGSKGGSVEDTAALLLDAIEDREVTRSLVTDRMFKDVRNALPDATVNLGPAGDAAMKLLRRAESAMNIGESATSKQLTKAIQFPRDPGATFAIQAKRAPATRSWDEALNIRSRLLRVGRAAKSPLNFDEATVRNVSQLVKSVDSAMEKTAKAAGGDAEKLWRNASFFRKESAERFHNKLMQKLVNDLPDKSEVTNVIFRTPKNIKRFKKAVGVPRFQIAKGAFIEDIVTQSMKPDPSDAAGIGEPVGNKILSKFNGIGQEGLDLAFTRAEQKTIRNTARTMAIIQARTGGQAGALRFVQGAALAGLVVGPVAGGEAGRSATKGSGLLLIGPAVLGRLMTNPTVSRILSEGAQVPAGSQQSVALTTRLIRNVLQTRREINTEREKARRQAELDERIQSTVDRKQQLPALRGTRF